MTRFDTPQPPILLVWCVRTSAGGGCAEAGNAAGMGQFDLQAVCAMRTPRIPFPSLHLSRPGLTILASD